MRTLTGRDAVGHAAEIEEQGDAIVEEDAVRGPAHDTVPAEVPVASVVLGHGRHRHGGGVEGGMSWDAS